MQTKNFTKGELLSVIKTAKTFLDEYKVDQAKKLIDYVYSAEINPTANTNELVAEPANIIETPAPQVEALEDVQPTIVEKAILDEFFKNKIVEISEDAFNKYVNDGERELRQDEAVRIISGKAPSNQPSLTNQPPILPDFVKQQQAN